jgi:transposase
MALKGRRATPEERLSACEAIENGASPDIVAQVMGVSRASVFAWQKTYREHGAEALQTKPTPGREPSLSDLQMSELRQIIIGRNPQQLDFGPALWTRGIVRELVQRKFGVTLSEVSIGRILHKLGLSPQRPLYKAYEQDPGKVAEWKEKTFPQIQARAKKEGAAIFFADESSVRTDYHAGTTWAPVHRTPVVQGTGKRRSISMVSAVNPRGELHFDIQEKGITSDDFLAFCKKLIADAARPVFLILDNSQVHRAIVMKEYARQSNGMLTLFFLPPYSPELNPDEWVWKNVKNDNLGRAAAKSTDDLARFARIALNRLKDAPHIVRAFFGDPVLAYISSHTAQV